jgi:hypothetical protein
MVFYLQPLMIPMLVTNMQGFLCDEDEALTELSLPDL